MITLSSAFAYCAEGEIIIIPSTFYDKYAVMQNKKVLPSEGQIGEDR